jgi:serine/threonine protein kinase
MSDAEAPTSTGTEQKCHGCGTPLEIGATECPTCKRPVDDITTGPINPVGAEDPVPSAVTEAPGSPALGETTGEVPKPPDLSLGDTLMGQWQLESKLGEGAMGKVYLATELKLGRKVAVKALSPANLNDETVKRFEREAQTMAKLDHPNVVTLYAVGRHNDIPFLVMRYLEGGSLWDLLDAHNGRLTPEQLFPLLKQLCSALGYIHGKGLTHRDLKPSNIYVSAAGKVTVLDLGLGRGHATSLSRAGVIFGTPEFMAPEQIVGEKPLDGRADLYTLGVVLYRMMANETAFPDPDVQSQLRAHLSRPRPDLTKVWGGASPALAHMLQKAMAIKPEERFQTADELLTAFERAMSGRDVAQPLASPPSIAPVTVADASPPSQVTLPVSLARQPEEEDSTAVGVIDPATLLALKAASERGDPERAALEEAEEISASEIVLEKSGIIRKIPAELLAPGPQASMVDAPPVADPPTLSPVGIAAPASPSTASLLAQMSEVTKHDLDEDDRTAVGFLDDPGSVLQPEPPTLGEAPPKTTRERPPRAAEYATLDGDDEPKTEIASPVRPVLHDGVAPLSKPAEVTGPLIVRPPSASGTPAGAKPVSSSAAIVKASGSGTPAGAKPISSSAAIIKHPGGSGTPASARAITANAAIIKPSGGSGTPASARAVGTGSGPRPRRSIGNSRRDGGTPRPSPPPPPAEDALSGDTPPWLHPYVLVVGGLLLLAMGFLIGVLLR